jgi:hypothetical protein
MGWWGYNIMEGDTPLDCEGDIIGFLADPELVAKDQEGGEDWEAAYTAVQESGYDALKVEANVLSVFQALNDEEIYAGDGIGMQVLGEMIMCAGGVFPDAVRCACIAAAKSELDESTRGWRDGGEGREQCLRDYILRVVNYAEGDAVEPSSQGLFATIGAALEGGLINK